MDLFSTFWIKTSNLNYKIKLDLILKPHKIYIITFFAIILLRQSVAHCNVFGDLCWYALLGEGPTDPKDLPQTETHSTASSYIPKPIENIAGLLISEPVESSQITAPVSSYIPSPVKNLAGLLISSDSGSSDSSSSDTESTHFFTEEEKAVIERLSFVMDLFEDFENYMVADPYPETTEKTAIKALHYIEARFPHQLLAQTNIELRNQQGPVFDFQDDLKQVILVDSNATEINKYYLAVYRAAITAYNFKMVNSPIITEKVAIELYHSTFIHLVTLYDKNV